MGNFPGEGIGGVDGIIEVVRVQIVLRRGQAKAGNQDQDGDHDRDQQGPQVIRFSARHRRNLGLAGAFCVKLRLDGDAVVLGQIDCLVEPVIQRNIDICFTI